MSLLYDAPYIRDKTVYLNNTRNTRRGHTRVFIHWNQSIHDIYQGHVSKGIVDVVKTAYLSSDENLPEKVTMHELRALAVLWAYNCHSLGRCSIRGFLVVFGDLPEMPL